MSEWKGLANWREHIDDYVLLDVFETGDPEQCAIVHMPTSTSHIVENGGQRVKLAHQMVDAGVSIITLEEGRKIREAKRLKRNPIVRAWRYRSFLPWWTVM